MLTTCCAVCLIMTADSVVFIPVESLVWIKFQSDSYLQLETLLARCGYETPQITSKLSLYWWYADISERSSRITVCGTTLKAAERKRRWLHRTKGDHSPTMLSILHLGRL